MIGKTKQGLGNGRWREWYEKIKYLYHTRRSKEEAKKTKNSHCGAAGNSRKGQIPHMFSWTARQLRLPFFPCSNSAFHCSSTSWYSSVLSVAAPATAGNQQTQQGDYMWGQETHVLRARCYDPSNLLSVDAATIHHCRSLDRSARLKLLPLLSPVK